MIPRYAPKDVAALFSDEHRFDTMLEVELLAAEALGELGDRARQRTWRPCARVVPTVDADFVDAVNEREAITNHDTAAFVDVVQERIGMPEGAWVHYGLTSSDVVDTALCYTLAAAMDIVIERTSNPARRPDAPGRSSASTRRSSVARTACTPNRRRTGRSSRSSPCRSIATSSGAKRARAWHRRGQAERGRRHLLQHRPGGRGVRLCSAWASIPVPATQVIARDRHAEVLYACAAIGTSIEQFALEVRHLARSEVGEVEEPFAAGQKGSSAMPHKRNPVVAERSCGLARVLRGYLQAGLEDVALWHERDISHSSVERVVLPDALMLTVYMLRKATWLADGLGPARRARPRRI